MHEYVWIVQDVLLIISNLSLLPAIYLAAKGHFRCEAILFATTMFASMFYHLCDNQRVVYCVAPYSILQYLDFYSAILTVWSTAIILASVPYHWISTYHLSGSIIYATLLFNSIASVWSFVIPGFLAVLLITSYWGHMFYTQRRLPEIVYKRKFMIAVGLMTIGTILFATQLMPNNYYGFTHSVWHICMGAAITLLLPPYRETFFTARPPEYRQTEYKLEVALPDSGKFPREDLKSFPNPVFTTLELNKSLNP